MMMNATPLKINADQAIGQIAVQLPGATAVFRRLKLDFCCGGHLSLQKAAADKMLDLDTVVAELSALVRSDQLPTEVEPSDLIDHILTRYHDVHREQLPELVRMARRVEAVHRDNPNVPKGLAELLEGMEQELAAHMHKEEEVLFPLMRAGVTRAVGQPIAMMRHEHTGHGVLLDCVLALTHDATPPPGACNTWRALYAGIAQFRDDITEHIHLENNVLFPQFESTAPATSMAAQGCGSAACGCA
jgi:regulator of cell morphogenesis and NO signaling